MESSQIKEEEKVSEFNTFSNTNTKKKQTDPVKFNRGIANLDLGINKENQYPTDALMTKKNRRGH